MGMSLTVTAGFGLVVESDDGDLSEFAQRVWEALDEKPKWEEDLDSAYEALEALCSRYEGLSFDVPDAMDYNLGAFIFAESTSKNGYYEHVVLDNITPTEVELQSLNAVKELLGIDAPLAVVAAPSYG